MDNKDSDAFSLLAGHQPLCSEAKNNQVVCWLLAFRPFGRKINLNVQKQININFLASCFWLCEGEPDAEAFTKAVFAYGRMAHLLFCHYQTTELQARGLFTRTAKQHALCHSALYSRFISPRLLWCFLGEDMMRVVQTLTQASTRGNAPLQGPMKALRHWRFAVHMEWTK